MPLEDVIAGAVSDAREDGVVGSTDAVETDALPAEEPAVVTAEETPAAEDPAAEPVAAAEPATEPAKTDEDALAKELGLKPRQDGKENRIPYSRVKSIVANAEKKAVEKAVTPVLQEVAEALGVDPTTVKPGALKDLLASRAPAVDPEIQAEITHMREVETLVQRDPDTFIRALAETNPAYKKFAAILETGGAPAATTTAAATPSGDMPEPDYDMGNGQKTYSLQGVQALVRWAVNEGKAQAEQALAPRLRPIEEEFTARRAAEEARPRYEAMMKEATTWDGFKDHATEILEVLKADSAQAAKTGTRPRLTLEAAYRQVVIPKLKASLTTDREKVRAEILAELKAAPAATSTVTTAPAKTESPTSLEGVIRQAVAAHKSRAGLA